MKIRIILAALPLLLSAVTARPQQHGLLVSGGWCIPNDATYSYVSQPTVGLAYLAQWQQRDGWLLGVRADAVATRQAIAGSRFSLSLNMEDHLIGPINNLFELGLSAYTNPYRSSGDTANQLIGTILNCHIGVGLRYRLQLDSATAFSAAFRFIHSSNGYLRKPNRGLNYVQLELGMHLGSPNRRLTAPATDIALRPWNFFVSYAPGVVQRRGPDLDAAYYYAHSLLVGALHPFSHRRLLGAEIDFMYNYAHSADARRKNEPAPRPLYVGLCATYQRNWDQLFMRVSVGSDVLRSDYLLGYVYERISLNCRLSRNPSWSPYVGIACKAYYAHIDYIEWTLGLEF